MTKKIFFTVLTVFYISFTTNSYAECDGFYIAGRIGQAKIELEDSRSGFNDYSNDKLISKRRLMASGGSLTPKATSSSQWVLTVSAPSPVAC